MPPPGLRASALDGRARAVYASTRSLLPPGLPAMTSYQGACHCGAVRFEIETELEQFTRCDCSLCRKKNAVMAAVPESGFKLLQGADELALYKWNTMVAKHYFCRICGIYTFHRKRSAPDHFGVNVFCLENAEIDAVPIVATAGSAMSLAAAAPTAVPSDR